MRRWWPILDVAAVMVFVVAGRANHREGLGAVGILETAAPFLIALAVGWLAVGVWRHPSGVPQGVGLWVVTAAGGLLLRRVLFDEGTAATFVMVAAGVLGLLLIGWRVAASRWSGTGRGSV